MRLSYILFIAITVISCNVANKQPASATDEWKLVWSDEFDYTGLPDSNKWGYETGGHGWGNNEKQYYVEKSIENSVVKNGVLSIIALKKEYKNLHYTSAKLTTYKKVKLQYGKIEIMAKLPKGKGNWPAIWMLPESIQTKEESWPLCGEIDIMEHVGNQLNKIYATLHHPGHSGGNGDGSTTIIPDATTAFHSYIMEWSATSIKFYVDTQLFYTFANNASLPFNQNFFVILNMAMGGNFGGAIDPAFTSASMEIDYVRVYQ